MIFLLIINKKLTEGLIYMFRKIHGVDLYIFKIYKLKYTYPIIQG